MAHSLFRSLPVWIIACALLPSFTFAQEEADLTLRLAWGGGEARQWYVNITIDEGRFSSPKPLGIDPDVPGSIEVNRNQVQVRAMSPRDYDGLDLRVHGSLKSQLTIELYPRGEREEVRRKTVRLSDVVNASATMELPGEKNYLLIRRTPGDLLRIRFPRDSLVFSPGDKLPIKIAPHLASLPPGELRANIQLLRGRTEAEVWSKQMELMVDGNGNAPSIGPLDVEIPLSEGVYDLRVTLTKDAARLLVPFARAETVLQRKVQLVVVDPKLADAKEASDWELHGKFDPANPGWWDRLKKWQLPQLKLFGDGPIGVGASSFKHDVDDRKRRLTQLAPNGWQAYPLPVQASGRPHILEVSYPSDLPQTLGISIVEPNSAGDVIPIGLDSGVSVTKPDDGHFSPPTIQRHRLIFWPRSKSPILLMTNQNKTENAVYGEIKILAGPDTLPKSSAAREGFQGRMVATYFDKPLFTKNFSATEGLDETSRKSRDDWETFYSGGRRLTEYLDHVGYNAAFVSVMCEGSSIYPSRLLQSTPKYDRGTFFTTGQDPVQKDVLEMLLTMFDRQGLTLVPSLRFSSPLPALEHQRRWSAIGGIELVNENGERWLDRQSTHQGLAPYYNPLDDRVQKAMVEVVDELVNRYGHHPSFGGVALQLGPYTYAQLPGENWGFDDQSLARFRKDTGVENPKRDRTKWLQWRSQRMERLYGEMAKTLRRKRRDGRIYLLAADSLTSLEMQANLRPTLPQRATANEPALLSIGIDQQRYQTGDIVLLRPGRFSPALPSSSQSIDVHLDHSHPFDRQFDNTQHAASFYANVPQPTGLPAFERLSPFGSDRTQIWLVPHIAESGLQNRRRFIHNLARFDTQTFVEGGWMSVMGQEDSLRDAIEVVRRLPNERFQNVTPLEAATPRQGIVVRKLNDRGRTYFYVVNDSPWPAIVELDMAASLPVKMDSLNSSRDAGRFDARMGVWRISLKPYDVIGARFSDTTNVKDWRVTIPKGIQQHLERVLADIDLRFKELAHPQAIDVLANPGFEEREDAAKSIDWLHAKGDNVAVVPDGEPRNDSKGKRSLRMSVLRPVRRPADVAWLRSLPFDVPKTGRITVLAWLRVDRKDNQPPLRLAIEGRYNGEVYYKYVTVGGLNQQSLSTKWKQYRFYVDNLPQSGLTKLRVGFDLMDRGTVYVDDVEVHDRWFGPDERRELQNIIAPARLQLSRGHAVQFQRFLESYWARFLLEHVPANPRVANNPQNIAPRAAPADPKPENKGNFFKRFIFGG